MKSKGDFVGQEKDYFQFSNIAHSIAEPLQSMPVLHTYYIHTTYLVGITYYTVSTLKKS